MALAFFLALAVARGQGTLVVSDARSALAPASGQAGAAAGASASPAPDVKAMGIGALWVPLDAATASERSRLDALVARLRAMPFNEFLIQAVADGNAFYASSELPSAPGLAQGLDPLAVIVDALHRGPNPKRVVAWVDPYRVGNLNTAVALGKNHVLLAHSDWLSLREDGDNADASGDLFMDLGLPAVQQHLEAVLKELAGNYALDGILLDPMGDPAGDGKWGYHSQVIERWKAEQGGANVKPSSGDPRWQAFRADIVTDALKGFVRAIQSIKPGLPVGAGYDALGQAPSLASDFARSTAYAQCHQDLSAWLRMDGLARVCARDFHADSSERASFDGWLNYVMALAQGHDKTIVIGVGGDLNDPLDALFQLRRAADSGAGGLALWNADRLTSDLGAQDVFLNTLGRTVFSTEGLAMLAAAKPTPRRQVRLKAIAKETLAAEERAAADVAQALSSTAPRIGSDRSLTDASLMSADAGGGSIVSVTPDDRRLPSPPALDAVPDESPDGQALPTANGRLIGLQGGSRPVGESNPAAGALAADADAASAQSVAPSQPGGNMDRQALAALDSLSGASKPKPPSSARPGQPTTRVELIDELLNDPAFRATQAYQAIWGTDEALRMLKQKFDNIFD
jgi:uncharacterized lipoprotein YddW (UPF0748 family)